MYRPTYIELYENGELAERIKKLNQMLKKCTICPHDCKVNRLENEKGFCRAGAKIKLASFAPHFGEEDVLVGNRGSGTIFLSYCTLQCVFCQNCEISSYGEGYEVSPSMLADIMMSLQNGGCHNINFVSPTHYVPQILEAIYLAAEKGLTIPLVYNTGGYDKIDTLRYLEGIIDIYMPDIKFGNNNKARKYTKSAQYFDVAKAAVKEMYRQVGSLQVDNRNIACRGLLIRHLLMPDNLADSKDIVDFIAHEISPDTCLNIMTQYHPAHKAHDFPELLQRIEKEEYYDLIEYAKSLGLNQLI